MGRLPRSGDSHVDSDPRGVLPRLEGKLAFPLVPLELCLPVRPLAGGSVRDLDRMVTSIPAAISFAKAVAGHRGQRVARERHSPRLQGPGRAMEVLARR
jgi:hypothetical protein